MFIAIDVGNSCVKLAAFSAAPQAMPLPDATLTVSRDSQEWERLDQWLAAGLAALPESERSCACWMTSVQRTTSGELLSYLKQHHNISEVQTLTWRDFPLQVDVEEPECVGVDRLAAAFAANLLTEKNRSAIVVDFGSAITVDRVSAQGHFEGGAILPGIGLAADALHRSTDALPLVDIANFESIHHAPRDASPHAEREGYYELPGKSTQAAIAAGLYWGAVGAVRELVARLTRDVDPVPAVFVTGGAAQTLTPHLGEHAKYEPDLVLRGVALVAIQMAP